MTNSQEKKGSDKVKAGSPGGLFKPVSDFLCKIGLGADDCNDEMVLAELVEKYRTFCHIQKKAAHLLSMLSNHNDNPRDFSPSLVNTITQDLPEVLAHMEHLVGDKLKSLFTCLDKVDGHVTNMFLSEQEGATDRWQEMKDRVEAFCLSSRQNFERETCRSFQSLLRCVLHVARQTMFDLCIQMDVGDKIPRQLVAEVPLQYWVIDLDGGITEGDEGRRVNLEDIVSSPMRALWEGLTIEPWTGPPPVNAKGFLSVMFQCTRDPCLDPGVVRPFAKRNHIILSKHFCNLTSRLGFHYTTAEGFVGEDVEENYASFQFKGGAACQDRRERRVRLIGRILDRFGFVSDIEGDNLFARLDSREPGYMLESLKVLGYLMTHTRQLDMGMCSDASVDWYYQELMQRMSSVIHLVE